MGELVERLKQAKSKEEQQALQRAFSGRGTVEEKLARGEQAARYTQPTTAKLRSDTDNWYSAAEQIYGDQRMAAYLKAANQGVERFYRGMELNRPGYTPGFNLSKAFEDYIFNKDTQSSGNLPAPGTAQTASAGASTGDEAPALTASPWERTTAHLPDEDIYQYFYGPQFAGDKDQYVPPSAYASALQVGQRQYVDPRFQRPDNVHQEIGRTFRGAPESARPGIPMTDEEEYAWRHNSTLSPIYKLVDAFRGWAERQDANAAQVEWEKRPLPISPDAVSDMNMSEYLFGGGTEAFESDRNAERNLPTEAPELAYPIPLIYEAPLQRRDEKTSEIYDSRFDWLAPWIKDQGVDPKDQEQVDALLSKVDDVTWYVLRMVGYGKELGSQTGIKPTTGTSSGWSSYSNPYSYGAYRYGGGGYGGSGYGGYSGGYGSGAPYQNNRYATSLGPVRWRF